jgi:uncharacterized membrane protein
MSDTVSRGPVVAPSNDDRVLATLLYALLFLTPFFMGLPALLAVVAAYVRRPQVDPMYRSHYAFQIRIFWIALVVFLLSVAAAITGLFLTFGALGPEHAVSVVTTTDGHLEIETSRHFEIGGVIVVIVAALALIADVLWLMLAAVFGVARLLSGEPIGRLKAA